MDRYEKPVYPKLETGMIIRMTPDGPPYRVESVSECRAYCVPIRRITDVVDSTEFGGEPNRGGGVNIAPTSFVTVVNPEDLETEEMARRKRRQGDQPSTSTQQERTMSASPIPVSNRSKNKAQKTALARKRADRAAGLPGTGRRASKLGATKKATAPKTVRKCACGCKEETMSFFAPGHDAKFKGWLKKIELGKMDVSELPKSVQEAYTWRKHGEGKIPTKNYNGEDYKPYTRA